MEKFLLALLVMLVFVTGCSSNNQSNIDESSGNTNESQDATNDQTTTEDSNILIAYFSKTGNTEAIAQEIQSLTNGTLVEIETVEPYPDSYSETVDIAESEKEANARPEISTTVDNMDQYDTIFIGYPKMEQGYICVQRCIAWRKEGEQVQETQQKEKVCIE